jgi:hypothetical protein
VVKSPRLAIAFFVISVSLSIVVSVGTTTAYASCNPNRANDYLKHYGVGWLSDPGGTVGGTYSSIYNDDPYLYSNGNDTTVGWTMINTSDRLHWAQIGWRKTETTYKEWIQWTHDGTFTDQYFDVAPKFNFTTYTVLYGYQPGDFTFEVNGTIIANEAAQFTPTEGQQAGEILTRASQMPGSVSGHEVLKNDHIYANGTWNTFSGTTSNANSSYFGVSSGSATEVEVWDKACP